MTKQELIKKIEQWYPRSAWDKGVKALMLMLVERVESEADVNLDDIINIYNRPQDLHKCAKTLSYGGDLLICDCDIAKLLSTPSELKSNKGGELPPNSRETWFDCQARACYQAFLRFRNIL